MNAEKYELKGMNEPVKKIAIVANHKTINYGTMLQAYATQFALESLGFRVDTLDLSGVEREIREKKLAFYNTQMTKRDLLTLKLPYMKKAIKRKLNTRFCDELTSREKVFATFRTEHFPMSAPCSGRAALTERVREYDVAFVGSDQIWSPANIAADVFTLSFVPDDMRTVAYASSFGVSTLPQCQHKSAKDFLNKIKYVSVREISGQALVAALAGREVPVVCDPTLLFTAEQWDKMIPYKRIISEPYIFCYFLGNNPDQRQFVKTVKEATGLKIVSLLHMDDYIPYDNRFADIAPYDIGPIEFLNLIRNAEYIFTDSFHGTALSFLYQKRAFTLDRFRRDSSVSTNTRIDSFFKITGLDQHHITARIDPLSCLTVETDYTASFARIEMLRKKSWDYLRMAMGETQV